MLEKLRSKSDVVNSIKWTIHKLGRRKHELQEKGEQVSLEDIKLNLENRDQVDSNRAESPLIKVADAVEIDTSTLTFSQQVDQILDLVKKVTIN